MENMFSRLISIFTVSLMLLSFSYPVKAAPRDTPENLVKALKRIAEIQDFTRLRKLCSDDSDEIAQSICNIGNLSEQEREEFSTTFSTVEIDGDIVLEDNKAMIPMKGVDNADGERTFTILLSKEGELWYLNSIILVDF